MGFGHQERCQNYVWGREGRPKGQWLSMLATWDLRGPTWLAAPPPKGSQGVALKQPKKRRRLGLLEGLWSAYLSGGGMTERRRRPRGGCGQTWPPPPGLLYKPTPPLSHITHQFHMWLSLPCARFSPISYIESMIHSHHRLCIARWSPSNYQAMSVNTSGGIDRSIVKTRRILSPHDWEGYA
jgi:hypothetical protein